MKFYEVQEQWNNLQWHTLAYFKRKQDAEKYVELFHKEKRVSAYPSKIEERIFSKLSELLKDD